jgi:hypothetical protein
MRELSFEASACPVLQLRFFRGTLPTARGEASREEDPLDPLRGVETLLPPEDI